MPGQGAGVGSGVGSGVGGGVGSAVGFGVAVAPGLIVGFGVGLEVGFGVGRGVATGRGTLIRRGSGVPGSRSATSCRTWLTHAAVMNEGYRDGTIRSCLTFASSARPNSSTNVELTSRILPSRWITSASNDVTTAVDGVTFKLKALGASTVTVNRDDTAISTAAQDFAKAYNDLRDAIAKLRSGNLASDSSLRTIEGRLSSVLQTSASVGGSFSYLTEIGISRDRYGKMQVDAGRLTSALGTDPAEVIALFTHATEGVPARLEEVADVLTRSDGLIAGREEGLNSRVRLLEDQQLRYERRLELIEQRLRAQFTALDNLVSQMQSTGTFLTQQLALQQNNSNQ